MQRLFEFLYPVASSLGTSVFCLSALFGTLAFSLPTAPCTAKTTSFTAESAPSTLTGVVNINEATIEELSLLPTIGPTRAARIVRYRKKRSFKRKVELARVRGIGLKTVRRLKPYLTIKGATTLRRLGQTPGGHVWVL